MGFAATMLFWTLLQQPAGMTPEEEKAALDRGQKYLDAVAASWAGKLPQERLLGVYAGRVWMGTYRVSINSAPSGSTAVFQLVERSDLRVFKWQVSNETRVLLDARLLPISGEQTETDNGKTSKLSIMTAYGKWTVKKVKEGKESERNGRLVAGTTGESQFLPLFVRPDDAGMRMFCLTCESGVNDFKRLSGTVEKTINGKSRACQVFQITNLDDHCEQWFFSDDGQPVEVRFNNKPGEMAIRCRPITDEEIGKSLSEPLELSP
ncbi:MAG: hypothetical protein JO332_10395, partial [Planctomycetaceae bacterium]|nr:hypothetical protein [Planctomycetaceae bacterium]